MHASTDCQDVQVCWAEASQIEGFIKCRLDTDEPGHMRKPDSLFMEAVS